MYGGGMTKALFVLTAADHWTLKDASQHPTGFWAEEFTTPYGVFSDAGWDLTVATPGGRKPVADPASLNDEQEAILAELAPVIDNPASLEDVDPDNFDVVFYPGGHGPMEDLAVNEASSRILASRLEQDRPLALLCHAPAAIAATADANGKSPFAGRKMTGFSNAEESAGGLASKATWLLEDKLVELGVDYSAAEPFSPHVVSDGNLHTGQNPASSKELAEAILESI